MKPLIVHILSVSCLLSCKKNTSPTEPIEGSPNILFIAVDDLNDWTGFLKGHPQAKTPNMDKLAENAIVFNRAYCSAPACNPSRVSVMTGVLPTTSGVYGNSDFFRNSTFLKNAITLPQWFSKNGYKTLGRGKLFHHPNGKWSDSISWQTKAWADGEWMNKHPKQTADTLANGMPYNTRFDQIFDWGPLHNSIEQESMDVQTANWAIAQLKDNHKKPFFLGAGFFRPHLPWNVPKKYYDLFPLDSIIVPEIEEDDLNDIPQRGIELSGGYDPIKDYQRIKNNKKFKEAVQGYLASISYADFCIGKVLDALNSSKYADNTVVVLWGDHGWNLGEKLHYRKFVLWEESTRVPLLIKVPGYSQNGSIVGNTVSLLDLYPTLTDLAGLPRNVVCEGQSLTTIMNNSAETSKHPVLTSLSPNDHSVRSKKYRYIRYADGTEELYDHTVDSLERKNLALSDKTIAIRQKLASFIPSQTAPSVSGNSDPRGNNLDRKATRQNIKYE